MQKRAQGVQDTIPPEDTRVHSTRLTTYFWLLNVIWTIVVIGLLALDFLQIKQAQQEMAKTEARANFDKDQAFRFWSSKHGGVYVPINSRTPQNPFLSHIPERDITTESGKALTLMNPAYMLRQMLEEYEDLFGIRGHITSLKHYRPETAPDEWERSALTDFERGDKEVLEFTEIEGTPYLRLMRPMMAKKSCLKCHAKQGYQVGDVRGGVSVSVPMSLYVANQRKVFTAHALGLGLVWLLGIAGIGMATRGLRNRIRERDRAEAELQKANDRLEIRVEERTAELNKEIEERKQAEEALGVSEELHKEAQRVAHIGHWELYPEIGTPVWSDEIFRIFGLNPQEREPSFTDHETHLHPDDWPLLNKAVTLASTEGTPFDIIFRIVRPDGEIRWMHAIGTTTKDEKGKVTKVFGTAQDITDFKQAEEELRESEEKHRLLSENVEAILWEFDIPLNRWTYVSPQVKRILGHSPDDFTNLQFWIDHIDEKDRSWASAYCAECTQKGESHEFEYRFLKKDSASIWLRDIVHVEMRDDQPVKMRGLMIDITERKKAEEQIMASLKEKEILLREIHHRVKNNMQVITSLLRLQSDTIKDQQYADMFRESQERIRSMALIHEKLYQSKEFGNIDFDGYLRTLINDLFISYGASPDKISIKIKTNDLSLELDYAIPCGLITNELVSNSLKYAFPGDGKGEINIKLRSVAENEMELTVSDNGIGIPEEFDFRTTESLGLDLVKVLTEHQLQGRIELNRTGGTSFSIRFTVRPDKTRI